jgi:hypothetical protein
MSRGGAGGRGIRGNLRSATYRSHWHGAGTTPSSSTMCFVAHVMTQLQSTVEYEPFELKIHALQKAMAYRPIAYIEHGLFVPLAAYCDK